MTIMSSSSVCQGLQSCVMEPLVVRLKLTPPLECPSSLSHSQKSNTHSDTLLPPPNTTHELSDTKHHKGGWSFLQSLCDKTEKPESEKVYVHPTVKRLSCSLSAKSLQMCTESLGSENGSESSDDISALFSLQCNTNTSSFTTSQNNADSNCVSKRWNRSGSGSRFPPPLSSMSEKSGVLVRPRREDGRLILEAVPAPSPPSFFKAERSNGRLTLRLFTTFHSSFSHHYGHESSSFEEKEEDEIEAEEEEEDDADEAEEFDENNEDETGIIKLPRPSRCSENGNSNYRNKQMLDWEPFWVAT